MENFNEYKPVQCLDCVNGSIINSLNYIGINYCESDIYFIGNGFDSKYRIEEEIFYSSNLMNSHIIFAEKIGLNINKLIPNDPINWLFTKLDYHEIVTMMVETKQLEYDSVFSNIFNTLHLINVISYEEKFALIHDSFIPKNTVAQFYGTIDINKLLMAWKGAEYKVWILNTDNLKYTVSEVKELGYQKFRTAIFHYIHSSDNDLLVNIYKKIYEMILSNNQNILNTVLDMDYQLKARGYYAFKKYILLKMKDINIDKKIISKYSNIINDYITLEMVFIKNIIKKDKAGILQVIQRATEISDKEKKILSDWKGIL